MPSPMADAQPLQSARPLSWDVPLARSHPESARDAGWLLLLKAEGIAYEAAVGGAPAFIVASVEPTTGDPELLAVTVTADAGVWWIDRRTMRPERVPEGARASEAQVMRAADLGDRVQLALGEPVLVRVGVRGDRFVVEGVRPLVVRTAFTSASYRRLAPMMASASTLAPLAIDAIDRALRLEAEEVDEPRVRRIYGRAYRRMDAHHTPFGRDDAKAARRALSRVVRLGRDVMLALDDARAFRADLARAIPLHDGQSFEQLHTQDLIAALHNRMSLVTHALSLLERARLSTLSLLPAIEATVGLTPRTALDALAAPIRSRRRRAVDERLLAMAEHCRRADGTFAIPSPAHAGDWGKLLRTLMHIRILGMDVRPAPMGASDESLLQAIEEIAARNTADSESQRREAELELLSLSFKGPFGPLAAPAVSVQLMLLRRLAKAKGSVAEGLSAALLRLREAALEAGARLASQGVIDAAEDAFYMPLDEIEQALSGELGAYAARVRLRREDDRRFTNFEAPRRIQGRHA